MLLTASQGVQVSNCIVSDALRIIVSRIIISLSGVKSRRLEFDFVDIKQEDGWRPTGTLIGKLK